MHVSMETNKCVQTSTIHRKWLDNSQIITLLDSLRNPGSNIFYAVRAEADRGKSAGV
jgi:hypothetical protein